MISLSVFLVTLCVVSPFIQAIEDDDTQEHWDAFKVKHGKNYSDPEEEQQRRDIFVKNLLHVALHNVKDEHTYVKDVHEFSDMTEEEQVEMLCQTEVPADFISSRNMEDFSVSERQQIPSEKDWVKEGKLTPVRNQGQCGSCWAFATTEVIESHMKIYQGYERDLSEQQLVDCSGDYGNGGCDGGWPQSAMKYIKAKGQTKETYYNYVAKDQTCKDPTTKTHYKIKDYKNVGPAGDDNAVMNALATKGPLTSAIYVSNEFMHYGGGIFEDKTFTDQGVNHAVVLSGYGTEDGKDFWLIRNSWGPSWGEDGNIRIARGEKDLGATKYCAYPIL